MGLLGQIFINLEALIGPGAMLLYPLYASVRAIETPSTLDDQQWLTYWVIYSLIAIFELTFWRILEWIPIWPYAKLFFCLWLVLPMFNGAAYVYSNVVRKYVKLGWYVDDSEYAESYRRVMKMMSLDARKSVERYIEKYGVDAFERVVKAAEKEARRQ